MIDLKRGQTQRKGVRPIRTLIDAFGSDPFSGNLLMLKIAGNSHPDGWVEPFPRLRSGSGLSYVEWPYKFCVEVILKSKRLSAPD